MIEFTCPFDENFLVGFNPEVFDPERDNVLELMLYAYDSQIPVNSQFVLFAYGIEAAKKVRDLTPVEGGVFKFLLIAQTKFPKVDVGEAEKLAAILPIFFSDATEGGYIKSARRAGFSKGRSKKMMRFWLKEQVFLINEGRLEPNFDLIFEPAAFSAETRH